LKGNAVDGKRFDEFTRAVATNTSRRKVLGVLGAGIAAITTRLTGAQAGCTPIPFGDPCSAECCTVGTCINGFCGFACAEPGQACGPVASGVTVPTIDCCGGSVCVQGICEIICAEIGEACVLPDGIGSAGLPPSACCDEGAVCIAGTCQFPEPICGAEGECCGGKCATDCCNEGLECIDFICTVPVCVEGGGECADDGQCCTGICCGGICADIECCIEDKDPNGRCNEGEVCFEGVCDPIDTPTPEATVAETTVPGDPTATVAPTAEATTAPVTQLPNTGAGGDSPSRTSWFGAAAIGSAAAFLGGKRLMQKPEPARIRPDENQDQ